jgi:hypothetical protein
MDDLIPLSARPKACYLARCGGTAIKAVLLVAEHGGPPIFRGIERANPNLTLLAALPPRQKNR